MQTLWNFASDKLLEGRALAGNLDSCQYTTPCLECFGGTLGGHFRHCLQHFQAFQTGVSSGVIDYDDRERGNDIETDPAAALELIDQLSQWCLQPGPGERRSGPIMVLTHLDGVPPSRIESSVERELQFVISHTIHHFAIVSIMCRSLGISVDPDFGVAPATIRHQLENSA